MSLWSNTDVQASKPKFLTKKVTFDASSASVVNLTNNTIAITGYGFDKAEAVLYSNGGGTAITGLTSGATYYAIPMGDNLIKLATTVPNANEGTAIDLTVLGVGAAHTIQALAANIFFVDETEAQVATNKAKGITGAGWWKIVTYTDAQSATRYKTELLVACSTPFATSGDATDDATVADA